MIRMGSLLMAIAFGLMPLATAQAQGGAIERHGCPVNDAATFSFFKTGDTEHDRDRIEQLAPIAKGQRFICILAYVERDVDYSRKLAIRRVKWVLDNLTSNGVPREIVGIEFRPMPPSTDKDLLRRVDVIFAP